MVPEHNELVATIEAVCLDDTGTVEAMPKSSDSIASAAAVLQPVNGNAGEPLSPDPHSQIPSTVRGA